MPITTLRMAAALFALTFALTGSATASDVTAPAAPTAAAAATPAACGNGLLDAGETCDQCAADCRPGDCKAGTRRTVTVDLTPQVGFEKVNAVGIIVPYRTSRLTLPGAGNEPAVSARFSTPHKGTQLFVNDLGYAVRVVASSTEGLPAGPLLTIAFDGCDGAAGAQAGDVGCRVESCSSGGGPLTACTCAARVD